MGDTERWSAFVGAYAATAAPARPPNEAQSSWDLRPVAFTRKDRQDRPFLLATGCSGIEGTIVGAEAAI